MSVLRSQFTDMYLEDALPALEKVTQDLMDQHPEEYKKLFNMGTMKQGIKQHTQVSGLETATAVGEGAEYPRDEQVQGYDKTFTAIKYGAITAISQEALDDDQYEVFNRRPEQLARAMQEARCIAAADIFNNSGSDTGPDGVSLLSTAHPLAKPGAGTNANRAAADADLSLSSLEDIVTIMRKTKDNAGKRVRIRPRYLVVGPDLEFLAHELLNSQLKPQASTASSLTEENAINSMRTLYGMEVVVMEHITDDDAFWIVGDKSQNELWWYTRKPFTTSSDMEFKSDIALLKGSERYAVGYSDWRGIAGSLGA